MLTGSAAGFALDNVALIVAGTLVGSSGTILTLEMATAMNRSVPNILFAGFGALPEAAAGAADDRPHRSIGAQDAAIKLAYADSVVVVPGYGLAVAQARFGAGACHRYVISFTTSASDISSSEVSGV